MTAFTGMIHGFHIRLKIHTDYRNDEPYGFMGADSAIENIGTCSPSGYRSELH